MPRNMYTEAEEATMREMKAAGRSYARIAVALGRSKLSVETKWKELQRAERFARKQVVPVADVYCEADVRRRTEAFVIAGRVMGLGRDDRGEYV